MLTAHPFRAEKIDFLVSINVMEENTQKVDFQAQFSGDFSTKKAPISIL